MLQQLLRALIQFDIVGEQTRAFHAHAFEIARQLLAAGGELNNLAFDTRSGGFLRAGTARRGRRGRRARREYSSPIAWTCALQSVELAARDLDGLFLIEAGLFLLRHQCLIALALGAGLFVLTREALQFQTRRREA